MTKFIPYTRRQLQKTLEAIQKAMYTRIAPLTTTAWRTPEPVLFEQRQSGEELHLVIGDKWGDLFDCAWFRFTGRVPPEAAGQPAALLVDVNGELCVVDEQGVPLRGLTTVTACFDPATGLTGKYVLPLAHGLDMIEIWADAGCNDLFGNLQGNGTVKEASIAICHEEVLALYYDFEVLLDALNVLPDSSPRHQQILVALNDAAHLLRNGVTSQAAQQARQVLQPVLQQRGGDPSLQISAIGHAHIDLAWLWPVRETKRKGARTFATALANMERYPDYVYAASQAQLFQWMKESYPVLYNRIRRRVAEGRLEPQGALWVECDTNLTGGESLVRQILYGKQFFRQEFGLDPDYVWLPDTFGYSAALPQIMRLAGIRFFSTQKLSWSLINRFPYHSFHWQGLDGSAIPVHMLPEDDYNSSATPRSVSKIESNYSERGISHHCLMVYGIGDGGGGPGEEHLERLARLKDFAGLSPVKQETTSAFFERWIQEAERFPSWVGELYLERHQGTFTSNARNKWYNRRIEQALRELEETAALSHQVAGEPYPTERLATIWREVLLYQFHDILPGSSIKRVYDESLARYHILLDEVEESITHHEQAIARTVQTGEMRKPAVVFNSLSWERSEWLKLEDAWQRVTVPPVGYTTVDARQSGDCTPPFASAERLENDRLCARFGADGSLVSLYDKQAGREAIPAGEKANQLVVYPDPGDAWDFPMDYAETEPSTLMLVSASAHVDGPRAVLEQVYRTGHSELVLEISLVDGRPWLEFAARLRWREPCTMLRVLFPVAVLAQEATFEIQFGHIHRPTHNNTSWDWAKQEVPAHKWVDLSQPDHGVALLNDSKYGHRVKGHVLEINLLRSVPYTGPRLVSDSDVQPGEPHHAYSDQAEHTFRYALLPHDGNAVTGGVIRAGYEFNLPLRTVPMEPASGSQPPSHSFLQVKSPDVIVETVKQAERGEGLVVRLYEATGSTVDTRLHFDFPLRSAELTDLLEEGGQALDCVNGSVQLHFHPFEIKTIRVG